MEFDLEEFGATWSDNISSSFALPSQTEIGNFSVPLDSCGRPQTIRFSSVYHESIWLSRVSFPIFLIIGTLGNVTGIILVFNERHDGRRRGSSSLDTSRSRKIFLMALFITDLCYLWNRLIYLLGVELWNLGPETHQLYTSFFTYTHGIWAFLDAVLSFSSQGLLVAFCVDRYHALTSPLKHKTSMTFQRTTSLLVVTLIYTAYFACSLILPVAYYWGLNNSHIKPGAPVPKFPEGLKRWRIFDAWSEVIIRIASAVVIVLLNRLIYVKLKHSSMKLVVHFEGPKLHKDPEAKCIMASNNSSRSKSQKNAVFILLSSSIFYLFTNCLDVAMSIVAVLCMYPVCVMQHSPTLNDSVEPARDFLRHSYFAFGFLFYVCLKLRLRESIRRQASSFYFRDVSSH